MRPSQIGAIPLLASLAASACLTPDEVRRSTMDRPDGVWANPDSVRVGETTQGYALACPPSFALCIGTVRDLRWAARPESVLAVVGSCPGQCVRLRGVRPGTAWVIGSGPGGADSGRVRVLPK